MLVSNFWETTFVCFSNLRFSIDPFSSISTAHAAGALPSFAGPKEGSKKTAWESLKCPLRSQNAIPAPYIRIAQQGPNNCDTVEIWFGPFWWNFLFAPTPAKNSILWKIFTKFSNGQSGKKIRERYTPGMTAIWAGGAAHFEPAAWAQSKISFLWGRRLSENLNI